MSEQVGSPPISLEALRNGDRKEFARLVDAYSTPIYRLALKILGDPQDAEDVLQETFIKALSALPTFEGRSSLSTWLYRIAVNEALMLLRRRKPETLLTDNDGDEDESGESESAYLIDWCCLPEEELLSDEAQRFLDKAIAQLPENLRLVFWLRDVEGLSIKETAETLGLSETNVKTRLLRARLKLREILSEYYGERVEVRSRQNAA
ncbi:RNA polymerase sigma factor [Thermanaerothrix sp.]|jgi:RNA polymerase sigma-70 factor (ECF subfamily)|uniref:RNA polymerase sigma factor n=1 Tax=Thermanaerothrix sp. TaxID=2972675 RepID=UPI002ADDCDDB|nr:sigma-70 family RNA polymerase sigma factor [Thermanaerothrix sp.]